MRAAQEQPLAIELEGPVFDPFAQHLGGPARQPHLLLAGLAFGEQWYLDCWQKVPDPTDPEVQRNIGITQPLLWSKF